MKAISIAHGALGCRLDLQAPKGRGGIHAGRHHHLQAGRPVTTTGSCSKRDAKHSSNFCHCAPRRTPFSQTPKCSAERPEDCERAGHLSEEEQGLGEGECFAPCLLHPSGVRSMRKSRTSVRRRARPLRRRVLRTLPPPSERGAKHSLKFQQTKPRRHSGGRPPT